MKEFLLFGYTLKEIFLALIKLGFVMGLILGFMLLLMY